MEKTALTNAFFIHQKNRHGSIYGLQCVTNSLYKIIFLIDQTGDHFCGVDISSAHLQKMGMSLFKQHFCKFLHIINLTDCCNRIEKGIYAARDRFGRTPVVIGRKEDAFCVSFENFAYRNLGYKDYKELKPGEIVV